MDTPRNPNAPAPGLCGHCLRAAVVRSAKGSTFLRCALADVSPAFPRYPALPVIRCVGFKPAAPAASGATGREPDD